MPVADTASTEAATFMVLTQVVMDAVPTLLAVVIEAGMAGTAELTVAMADTTMDPVL